MRLRLVRYKLMTIRHKFGHKLYGFIKNQHVNLVSHVITGHNSLISGRSASHGGRHAAPALPGLLILQAAIQPPWG